MLLSNPFSNATMDNAAPSTSPKSGTNPNSGSNNQQQQQNTGNQLDNPGGDVGGDKNRQQDNNTDGNNTNKGDDSLSNFSKLWDNPPEDPAKPKKPTGYLPEIPVEKLQEMSGKLDFSKAIKPEHLANITKGGEDAAKSLVHIINDVLRSATLVNFNINRRMVESGLSNANTRFMSEVPNHVKNILVEGNLSESNPVMADPAYAPIINSARERIQELNPKATHKQIEAAVNKYVSDFAAKATKKPGTEVNADNKTKLAKGDANANWEEWMGAELEGSNNQT